MTGTEYNQMELKKGEIKVILEFPQKAEQDEAILQEVKEILFGALQEYWKTLSETMQKGVL